jgi:hypothetical protein
MLETLKWIAANDENFVTVAGLMVIAALCIRIVLEDLPRAERPKKSWLAALLKPLMARGYSADLDGGPKAPPRGGSATAKAQPTGNVHAPRDGAELGAPPHQGSGGQK